jgi:hypothetical protein
MAGNVGVMVEHRDVSLGGKVTTFHDPELNELPLNQLDLGPQFWMTDPETKDEICICPAMYQGQPYRFYAGGIDHLDLAIEEWLPQFVEVLKSREVPVPWAERVIEMIPLDAIDAMTRLRLAARWAEARA